MKWALKKVLYYKRESICIVSIIAIVSIIITCAFNLINFRVQTIAHTYDNLIDISLYIDSPSPSDMSRIEENTAKKLYYKSETIIINNRNVVLYKTNDNFLKYGIHYKDLLFLEITNDLSYQKDAIYTNKLANEIIGGNSFTYNDIVYEQIHTMDLKYPPTNNILYDEETIELPIIVIIDETMGYENSDMLIITEKGSQLTDIGELGSKIKEDHAKAIESFLFVIYFFIFIPIVLSIFTIISINNYLIHNQGYEIAIYKILGIKRKRLFLQTLIENIILTVTGVIIGYLLGLLFSLFITPFEFFLPFVLLLLLINILAAAIESFVISKRIHKKSIFRIIGDYK